MPPSNASTPETAPALVAVRRPRTLGTALLSARLNVVESTKAFVRVELKRREWQPVMIRAELRSARIVVIAVMKDERPRLDYFLDYYRALGVEHFLMVDNRSTDGGPDLLVAEPDVSLFSASGRFGASRYGADWVNGILRRYCAGKWVVWVDADELLVFSKDRRVGLAELTSALDREGLRSMQTILLDMYSELRTHENTLDVGQDPLEVCDLFDCSGYRQELEPVTHTGWIKGGVRARLFFSDPADGPALNKTPLVQWRRHYVFLKVAHQLWPRGLNGRERLGGALLHFKFTDATARKMTDSHNRAEHTIEYQAYDSVGDVSFVGGPTTRYTGVETLVRHRMIEPLV